MTNEKRSLHCKTGRLLVRQVTILSGIAKPVTIFQLKDRSLDVSSVSLSALQSSKIINALKCICVPQYSVVRKPGFSDFFTTRQLKIIAASRVPLEVGFSTI